MQLPSIANGRGHSRERGRLIARQRRVVQLALIAEIGDPPTGPHSVELVRVSPRGLDDDNLRGCLKGPRDAVAQWLGYANDDHPDLRWFYDQEPDPNGRSRYQALRVTFAAGHADCEACGAALRDGLR